MELELNNYLINSPEKINKLKFDLMRKTTKASKYDIKTISSIYITSLKVRKLDQDSKTI